MSHKPSYHEVTEFLERYSTQEPPYDFNGLLQLVLAGIENLRVHCLPQDLLDYAHTVSDDQARFLRQLLDTRAQSRAEFEAERP